MGRNRYSGGHRDGGAAPQIGQRTLEMNARANALIRLGDMFIAAITESARVRSGGDDPARVGALEVGDIGELEAAGEIEIPHAAEAGIGERLDLLAVGGKRRRHSRKVEA